MTLNSVVLSAQASKKAIGVYPKRHFQQLCGVSYLGKKPAAK